MENKNYFVFAVMIAIIVPVAMGSLYFISMYERKGQQYYVSKAEEKNEVLLLGDINLSSVKKANSLNGASEAELLVKFTYGYDVTLREYKLVLQDVTVPSNVSLSDIKWIIQMYDEDSQRYLGLKSGNFEKLENGRLEISPLLCIELYKTQKFKLYYYVGESNSEIREDDFYANVILE